MDELVPLLAAILPASYKGTITLWSCQAARPWKHIQEVMQQLSVQKDVDLETAGELSYIRLLASHLGIKPQQVQGPIGHITSDRRIAKAQVYVSKEALMLDTTLPAMAGGIVNAATTPPDSFYAVYVSDEDSSYNGNDDVESENEVDMDVQSSALPTVPAFRSKQEYLDYIMRNAPFGQGGPPPSLRERLRKNKK